MKRIVSRGLRRPGLGRNIITIVLLAGALILIGASTSDARLRLSDLPHFVHHTLKTVTGAI